MNTKPGFVDRPLGREFDLKAVLSMVSFHLRMLFVIITVLMSCFWKSRDLGREVNPHSE